MFYPMTQQTGRLCEGYDQLIIGGYNSLTSKLAEGLHIELNKVITKIEDAVDEKQVKVTCPGRNMLPTLLFVLYLLVY